MTEVGNEMTEVDAEVGKQILNGTLSDVLRRIVHNVGNQLCTNIINV